MKYIVILLAFLPVIGMSQDSFQIDSVFTATGTQVELVGKTKIWVAQSFNSYKNVIETEDKEQGLFILKGTLQYSYDYYSVKKKQVKKSDEKWTDKARFTVKIFLKENKAKVVVSDIVLVHVIEPLSKNLIPDFITNAENKSKSESVDQQCEGNTDLSKLEGVKSQLKSMINSIILYLNKKAESDF